MFVVFLDIDGVLNYKDFKKVGKEGKHVRA